MNISKLTSFYLYIDKWWWGCNPIFETFYGLLLGLIAILFNLLRFNFSGLTVAFNWRKYMFYKYRVKDRSKWLDIFSALDSFIFSGKRKIKMTIFSLKFFDISLWYPGFRKSGLWSLFLWTCFLSSIWFLGLSFFRSKLEAWGRRRDALRRQKQSDKQTEVSFCNVGMHEVRKRFWKCKGKEDQNSERTFFLCLINFCIKYHNLFWFFVRPSK